MNISHETMVIHNISELYRPVGLGETSWKYCC